MVLSHSLMAWAAAFAMLSTLSACAGPAADAAAYARGAETANLVASRCQGVLDPAAINQSRATAEQQRMMARSRGASPQQMAEGAHRSGAVFDDAVSARGGKRACQSAWRAVRG